MSNYLRVLRSPDLRRLFSGLLISSTGNWAYNVALLVYLFERTHSVAWVGAATLARMGPPLLLSMYAGVLAERVERITLMVRSDLACMLFQVALAVTVALHGAPLVTLLWVVLSAGANTAYNPAVAATLPALAGEDELAAANALQSSIDQLVVIAGPAVGALAIALFSPSAVFAINAASFAASALIVSRISQRGVPVDVSEGGEIGLLRQLGTGVRTVTRHRAALTLVAYSALVTVLYGTDTVFFVDVSVRRLGTGAHGWGYLLAGLGVGGLLAVPLVDRLSRVSRLSLIILLGTLGYCLPTALLVVIHAPALAFAVQVLRGASTVVVDVLAFTALQRAVPASELGRVFGVYFAIVYGSIMLGSVIAPGLIDAAGLSAGLWTVALVPAGLALIGLPALLAIDRATAARAAAIAPLVQLLEHLEIFAAAAPPVLERLANAASRIDFQAGTTIIDEGDAADALYILIEGVVVVTARGEAGGESRPVRTMTASCYFGEIGLIEGIPRTATVIAEGACQCAQIDAETFLSALSGAPASSRLLGGVSLRLARTHPSRHPEGDSSVSIDAVSAEI